MPKRGGSSNEPAPSFLIPRSDQSLLGTEALLLNLRPRQGRHLLLGVNTVPGFMGGSLTVGVLV